MDELLGTKLFIPRPNKKRVTRPHLVDRLNAGLGNKLTLIAAPAGFGKTTLLSEWIPNSPRCVSWLSLDEGDNDPTVFWAYFITSLQGLRPDLGYGAITQLQFPQIPPITSILAALINDLTAFQDEFAIVLDDYHRIAAQAIHDALTFLLEHSPPNMHILITTRIDPPLPLARLRALNELTEIRANDLRFLVDEAAAFLAQVMGMTLPQEAVAALNARTEGWIAGLQIAALSMQGREDIPGFIREFSGSHRHILGYLADEVLNQRPTGTLKFLLQTSILYRLCGALCDAVTGDSGGQEILEQLVRNNLFITPIDEVNQWYRYHQLFAEVLRARLIQTDKSQTLELHRKAGRWYAQHGMTDESIHHLLAGEDFDAAAHLISGATGEMLPRGYSSTVARWLDAFPDDILRAHPSLCLARGWTFVWGSDFSLERADEWAQLALDRVTAGSSASTDLEGEAYALKALIAADRVDLALSLELSRLALERLSAKSPWLGVTTFCLGAALYASGDLPAASSVLNEALQLSQSDGARYIQLIAGSFLGDIEIFYGRLNRGMELYRQVLAWDHSGIPQKGALIAHAGLANVLCEQDHLDEAHAHVQSGLDQLAQVGGPGATLWLYRTLARIQQAKGNWAEALNALDQAYQSGQRAQIPFVTSQAAALRARVHLAQGDLQAATAWAADCGLDPDGPGANRPGLREIEYLTFARVLTAQGRLHEANTLLERLLDSSMVEERHGRAIEILALRSMVSHAKGDSARSFEYLERALSLAEPEGFVRVFVDEGEPMRLLLSKYQSLIKERLRKGTDGEYIRLLTYTDRLLAAFTQPSPYEKRSTFTTVETLSERELDILRLIATGRTNQEIADLLVIAVSTVKSHINNLYGKLGTNRRTEAVAIARDFGLLSN